jgi:hypothetical protein
MILKEEKIQSKKNFILAMVAILVEKKDTSPANVVLKMV